MEIELVVLQEITEESLNTGGTIAADTRLDVHTCCSEIDEGKHSSVSCFGKRYNRLAELLSIKKGKDYAPTVSWLRVKASFAI